MAARLTSIVAFASIPIGGSASAAHGLQLSNGRKLIPDEILVDVAGQATISADNTNVTVFNTTGSQLTINVLCKAWEGIERAFGVQGQQALVPRPFGVAQSVALAALTGGIVYGGGEDGVANFDGVNTFGFATLNGSVYTLTSDTFLQGGSIVQPGITVFTAGFRGFCNGTFTNNGVIENDGKNAVAGVAGAGSAFGTTGIGVAGGNGRAANTGLPGSGQANVLGDGNAPAGGNGGAGGVNGGGNGGAYNNGPSTNGGSHWLIPMLSGFLFGATSGGNQAQLQIIGGGAGGGGGGSDNGGVTGGGGGGGAGVLVWHAVNFINNGIVRARGGDGAAASGAGGNGGGGGGGGGGIILSLATVRSGSGTWITPGGNGGAPLGGAGVGGQNGQPGQVHLHTF